MKESVLTFRNSADLLPELGDSLTSGAILFCLPGDTALHIGHYHTSKRFFGWDDFGNPVTVSAVANEVKWIYASNLTELISEYIKSRVLLSLEESK